MGSGGDDASMPPQSQQHATPDAEGAAAAADAAGDGADGRAEHGHEEAKAEEAQTGEGDGERALTDAEIRGGLGSVSKRAIWLAGAAGEFLWAWIAELSGAGTRASAPGSSS